MKFSEIIGGAVVIIAVTAIYGIEGIPKPQVLVHVDGFAFNGPVERSRNSQGTERPTLVVPSSPELPLDQPIIPPVSTALPLTELIVTSESAPPPNTPIVQPESTQPSSTTLTIVPASAPTSNTPADEPTSIQPVTQSPQLAECIQNCRFRVTSEFNPVCGSDRSVYTNPGMLNCAKRCGHDVDHAYFGPCTSQIRG